MNDVNVCPDGCGKPVKARGLCATHYHYAWKNGTLPPKAPKPIRCRINNAECRGKIVALGLCDRHYHRQRDKGTTELTQPQRRLPPAERFRAYVSPEPCTCGHGCLLWTGGTTKQGYGVFFLDGGKVLAHRYAWILGGNELSPEQHVDHVRKRGCSHTGCVNLTHLEAVTPAENTQRAWDSSPPSRRLANGARTTIANAERRVPRFWAKTDQAGGPDAHWPWLAYVRKDGIATVFWMQTTQPARKIAWLLSGYELPDGQIPEQTCGLDNCMNPAHMKLVSRREIRARYTALAREGKRRRREHPDSAERE
jgi:hypothetical protein